ncbi:maleylpyruvate isomerase family mycothiol-dependent enzyme [Actinotalea sp. AC32]|nr:maleylpyruvate isomerase family mycothiol-dependent enzyme [Actinotalea sp. AC32]
MTTADLHAAAENPLTSVVDAVPAAAWSNPSPCEGWAARDVVRHLVRTQREFLTGRGADLGPEPDVEGDPAAAWREHTARVRALLADEAFVGTSYDGHFGPTTVGATFEQFYVWDMLVHRWDVARAAGLDADLAEDELDRVEAGADAFGEALYWDGVCRPGTEPAPDADRQGRVLARLGRAA